MKKNTENSPEPENRYFEVFYFSFQFLLLSQSLSVIHIVNKNECLNHIIEKCEIYFPATIRHVPNIRSQHTYQASDFVVQCSVCQWTVSFRNVWPNRISLLASLCTWRCCNWTTDSLVVDTGPCMKLVLVPWYPFPIDLRRFDPDYAFYLMYWEIFNFPAIVSRVNWMAFVSSICSP